MRPNFFYHLHPPSLPAEQSRWRYTLGAGGIAVFLALVIGVTGILEIFYYIPVPNEAGLSIQTLTYLVPFGALVRNLHFWSAQLLLMVSGIHFIRIVFTGSYAPPRRFNYLLGLSLFISILLLDFTGYILRWDIGIQWALVVGANLLKTIPFVGTALYKILVGGSQLGSPTLLRFYAWHIVGLTLLSIVLIVWHVFRVRRDGGVALPDASLRAASKRIARSVLVRREALAAIYTAIALLGLALVFPAPIAAPIRQLSAISDSARAPWFFLWVQKMLEWGNPFLWGVLIPLFLLILLALFPYIFPQPISAELGRWFPRSNRVVRYLTGVLLTSLLALTLWSLESANGF